MADYQRIMTPNGAINELDLEPMKVKLMDEADGYGWSLDKADAVGEEYRCFLYLNLKYPERYLVPSKEVDLFWHQHILDTQKYAEDCGRVFGKVLHHFPYAGLRGEEDAATWMDCYQKTLQLFRAEFPDVPARVSDQDKAALCVDETWPYAQDGAALCVDETWPYAHEKHSAGVRPVPKR